MVGPGAGASERGLALLPSFLLCLRCFCQPAAHLDAGLCFLYQEQGDAKSYLRAETVPAPDSKSAPH